MQLVTFHLMLQLDLWTSVVSEVFPLMLESLVASVFCSGAYQLAPCKHAGFDLQMWLQHALVSSIFSGMA